MRYNHWIGRIVGIALIAAIFLAGFGSAVWQLWNVLMPRIFGLPALGFWQAVGLLSLSWILFGSWRGIPRPHGYGRDGMRERWAQMSPEERERFRKGMRGRCGSRVSAPGTDASDA